MVGQLEAEPSESEPLGIRRRLEEEVLDMRVELVEEGLGRLVEEELEQEPEVVAAQVPPPSVGRQGSPQSEEEEEEEVLHRCKFNRLLTLKITQLQRKLTSKPWLQ